MFKNIIILAGGKSTRFFPFGDKNAFNFLGESLIEYQIKKFLPYAEKIYIVAHSDNHDTISHISQKYPQATVSIQKGEGQASALLSCSDTVNGESLVVNNCDIFNETSLFPAIEKMRKTYKLVLTAKKMTDYFPGGYLQFENNKLIKLIEKPAPENRPSDMVRLVVDYFADIKEFIHILQKFPHPHKDGAYEMGLNEYLSQVSAHYREYSDEWFFLKYPWHVLMVKDFFLKKIKKHRGKNVIVHNKAILEGDIFLDDGVTIHEYAKVVGPCYIGKDTIVGNYSMIRQSMIGDNCLIGGYTEVTRSYLGHTVHLHRNYVGDSVFENDILCGSGMVCANFRFDKGEISTPVKSVMTKTGFNKLGAFVGSHVKIGINSSLMPGVKIPAHTHITPHSFVRKDGT